MYITIEEQYYFNPHHRKVVTDTQYTPRKTPKNFNPHHRKVVTLATTGRGGRDKISIHTTARWWHHTEGWNVRKGKFQSTPPQGGDPKGEATPLPRNNFNPHHRKVVTFGVQPLTGSLTDFNPHHRKVVTSKWTHKNMSQIISIHTTARWWLQTMINRPHYSDFNPHHRKVVTIIVAATWAGKKYFNPHHRKVVTANLYKNFFY